MTDDAEIVRRLADGEDPWVIDPEHGCTNPLTGYFPAAEVEAELRRRRIRGCDDHDFVVITAGASGAEEPVGLQCKLCGRSWPVGRALPTLYDWAADEMGWACEECDFRTGDEQAALAHSDEQKHSLARAPIGKEQGETT